MDFLLHMCEGTFKRIGGVWYGKMRMMFEREEPGKMGLETPVRTSETLVREVPTTGKYVGSFLAEEFFPATMPEGKPVAETRLIGLREFEDELLQFLPRFELGFLCDVPKNDLDLMKLAHLNGNAGKGMHKPSPCIADDANDLPASAFQLLHTRHVLRNGFVGKKLPEKVPVTVRTSENHDAENMTEVRRVHHHDNISGLQKTRLHHCQIHLLLYPPSASSQLLTNFCVGLFSMRVGLQNSLRIGTPLLTKLFLTFNAFPELFSVPCTVLLDGPRTTTRTYFS